MSAGRHCAASHRAATVCSSTPPASPRQPACAPATPPGAANSTGRQSATWMATPSPATVLTLASALGTSAPGSACSGRSRSTSAPCTCGMKTAGAPRAWLTMARFSATAAGSSCTARPTFMLAWSPRLTPPARVVMKARTWPSPQSGRSQSSFSIGALRRMRPGKGVQRHAVGMHPHHLGHVFEPAVEALRIEDLRHQHAVRQTRRVAEAELAGHAAQALLHDLQPALHPVPVPAVLVVLADAHLLGQVAQHAKVVDRVDLAGDVLRQAAHLRPADRAVGQQRRLGIQLVQVLDDGQRLGQARLAVLQHRHQARARGAGIGLLLLFIAHQMHAAVVVVQAFQGQRDAHAPGGGGAEIAEEFHAGTHVLCVDT
eukprot:Opistho-2@65302